MLLGASKVESVFEKALAEHIAVVQATTASLDTLHQIAEAMTICLAASGKIFWCGNGGSAADAQHLAAELVGRFQRERRGLASLALTTDTSILTAVSNDYGYDAVFARQIQALGNRGDILVGISTSGNSASVLNAMQAAREQGLITVGFTGQLGGKLAGVADHLFAVPSAETSRIQEVHILAGHMLCDWVELAAVENGLEPRPQVQGLTRGGDAK